METSEEISLFLLAKGPADQLFAVFPDKRTDTQWTVIDQAWAQNSEKLFDTVVRKSAIRIHEARCDVRGALSPGLGHLLT